jgi:hypothetical protein
VERVEIFKSDGLYRYVYDGTTLTPDEQLGEHETISVLTMGKKRLN